MATYTPLCGYILSGHRYPYIVLHILLHGYVLSGNICISIMVMFLVATDTGVCSYIEPCRDICGHIGACLLRTHSYRVLCLLSTSPYRDLFVYLEHTHIGSSLFTQNTPIYGPLCLSRTHPYRGLFVYS